MTGETVSTLVINWNGAEYLPRCLEALSAQTFADFEVIVVDDGCSDSFLFSKAK